VNFLPGWFPAIAMAAKAPPELTFVGFTEDTSDNTVHTFTNHAIGVADVTRRVVVVAHASDSTTAFSFTGITIGGNAATIHPAGATLTANVTIASLLVPTGTTATIVVTKSGGTPDRCGIAVYRAINETSASPHATMVDDTMSAGVCTGTINIPANGWVVAGCQPANAVTPTNFTWVGVTEQYDGAWGDAVTNFRSGGFASGLPLEANRTITATLSAGSSPAGRLAAMSWG
jgi:hypothetical protein